MLEQITLEKKPNNNLQTLKLRRLCLLDEFKETKNHQNRGVGCVLTFCKRTQASLDLFADALEADGGGGAKW